MRIGKLKDLPYTTVGVLNPTNSNLKGESISQFPFKNFP